MQLVNDAVTWLTREIPQKRFASSPALAGQLILRSVERPYLPPCGRVGGLKWAPAEDEAEAGLANPGVSHKHHFGIHIMDRAGSRGSLRLAQQYIEVEFVYRKPGAGRGKARQRWMKA